MPTWPAAPFPQLPLQAGFAESPPANKIRTAMETGPAKVRRRSTAGPRPITWPMLLTNAELETFDDFYVTDLQDGTLSYDHINPRKPGNPAAKLRIVGDPLYGTPNGDNYPVTLKVEILP